MAQWRSRLGPLEERDFALLFAGRTVSLFGSALAPVALAFGVLELTNSPADLGLVLGASMLPNVLFLLVGGIWADRLPRHLVMVVADLVSGAAQLGVAVLLLTGTAEIWHLIALQALRGVASAFFFPAMIGVVPETVTDARIQQANALLGLSRNVVTIAGASAGGILVAVFGAGWALAIDAFTYFAGAVFLALIRLAPRTLPERRFVRELKEGWDDFRSRTWLWAIVVQFGFINPCWVAAIAVLGPTIADRELGGAAAWGLILAAQSVGLVVGGLLMLRWRPQRPLLAATYGIFLTIPLFLSLALPAPVLVIAAASLIAGVGHDIFGVLWNTALHEHIPRDRLARVSSYDALGSFVFSPIGAVVAGPVALAIGTGETLVGCAAVTILATAAVLISRDVRTLPRGRPELAT